MTAFVPTKTLQDIVPEVRPRFEELLAHATALGLQPKIREAGRTCATQAQYMTQGVTYAALCRSAHIIGHAIDLDIYPSNCPTYTKLGEWWEAQGGTWGGRWTQFGACGDMGHYHWLPGQAGAVSEAICPKGVSLEQCEQIREDYLTAAFNKKLGGKDRSWLWGLGLGVVGFGAVLYWRKR